MTNKAKPKVGAGKNGAQPRPWPADRVERRPIRELLAYPQNPMQHSEEQIGQIAASMREFGWTMPCLVDEKGMLIAGHGRLRAAQQLGLTEVPVMTATGWTEAQKRAYRIADNQLPRLAEWDETMLRVELTDLKMADYPIELLGFDDVQLVQFMAGIGTSGDPEATPEPPVVPVSRTGDLWLLGKHRLLCGDCTVADDVERLFAAARASVMITDPPYGVNYGDIANSRDRAAAKKNGRPHADNHTRDHLMIKNDDLDGPRLQAFLEVTIRSALPFLIDNPAFYLWHPMLTQGTFFAAAAAADILIHRQIIWVKPSLILGRGDYHWRHELCFYGWIRGKRCGWYQGRDQTTVWEIGRENDGIHPTQKPVECMKRPIENNSRPGDFVYDPFIGSGTTIIAAEMTGRACYAIEIDPIYIDVAVERWQTYAKKTATLEATGQTFEEVAAERKHKRKRAPHGALSRKRKSASTLTSQSIE